ncbi:siderophore-interacting protein [soil metagenome]
MTSTLTPEIETVMHGPFTFYPVTVIRTQYVTPKMLRITFGGENVAKMISLGPVDDVRIQFPETFGVVPMPPVVSFEPFRLDYPDDAPPSYIRAYTIRRLDLETGEVDIDFAIHGHGQASSWAEQASAGQIVCIGGPFRSIVAKAFSRVLLAGDETGLPGLGRAIEELPPDTRATVVIEIANASEEQQFPANDNVDLRWVHRNDWDGEGMSPLEAAVREVEIPESSCLVLITGESGSVRGIRRYLINERGLDKTWAYFVGYWKRGAKADDPHDHDEDED